MDFLDYKSRTSSMCTGLTVKETNTGAYTLVITSSLRCQWPSLETSNGESNH